MSSDEEFINDPADNRQRSLTSPVPPSAGGLRPESPRFDQENDNNNADNSNNNNNNANGDDFDQKRELPNGAVQHTTASEIANSDQRVRQVLYSDVPSPYFFVFPVLTRYRLD